MPRFLHLSDTHLGRTPYGSSTRREDLIEAFVQAIDIATESDVDGVVHTGDVTHGDDWRESLPARALEALTELRDADIPFLFVAGNHDRSEPGRLQAWARELEAANLGTHLSTESVDVAGVALYGVDYHDEAWWERTTVEFEPAIGRPPTLLCLHQSVEPLGSDAISELDLERLLDDSLVEFDAVLMGHRHRTRETTVRDALTTYAGATERLSRSEAEYSPSVTLVTVDDEGVRTERRHLDARPFESYTVVRGAGLDRERLTRDLDGHVEENAVLTVAVAGPGDDVAADDVRDVFEAHTPVDVAVDETDDAEELNPGIYRGPPDGATALSRIELPESRSESSSAEPTDSAGAEPLGDATSERQYREYLRELEERDGLCNFVFEPARWRERFDVTTDRGRWACPRDADEGCCQFHTPIADRSASAEDVQSAFRSEIRTDGRPAFVGARFRTLDLSYATLAGVDSRPVDLSYARVGGRLSLASATVRTPLKLSGASVGRFDVSGSVFERSLDATRLSISGTATFDEAAFERQATFREAGFQTASFERTVFERGANFEGARIERTATFRESRFHDVAEFSKATFVGDFRAGDAEFVQQATFYRATFRGECTLSRTTFRGKTNFRGATFEAKASFFAVQADDYLGFHDATFESRVSFYGATFDHTVYFHETTFDGFAQFHRLTTGSKGIHFPGAEFHADADFSQVRFGGRAFFDADDQYRPPATVDGDLTFSQATFRDDVSFAGVTVDGVARFDRATWQGAAQFRSPSDSTTASDSTRFEGPLVFDRGSFDGELDLAGVVCTGLLSADEVRVTGTTDLTKARLDEGATFEDAVFSTLVLDSLRCRETPVVTLSGAEIDQGSIHQVAPHTPLFDVTDARIGDVSVTGTEETAPVFESVLVDNTRFDGFEFIRARRQIPDSWELHRIGDRFGTVQVPTLSPKQKESVYRNAKNGASAVSDSVASAQFFQHEMRHKRAAHRDALPADATAWARARNLGVRAQNRLFQFTTGYGERTRRVLGTAFVLAFGVFPLLYGGAGSLWSDSVPAGSRNLRSYVELSLGAFAGITPSVPVDSPFAYLVYAESLVGTLVVAMLVLTLTRSVYR